MLRGLSHEQSGEDTTRRPTPTRDDALYATVRATISSIPIVGGALAEVFSATVTSPISRRTADWWDDLATRVAALERSGTDVQNLPHNAEFIGLVQWASQMATRNVQQEKLDALRNAVVNSAAGINIIADEKQLFLQLIDQLTPSQLKMLEFLDDPRAYGEAHGVRYGSYLYGGVDSILEEAFPEWRGRREVYDLVLHDLQTKGLVAGDVNDLHRLGSEQGMYARRTTVRGRRFMGFIRAS